MDEQLYYDQSLVGLEAIAEYTMAAAAEAERSADATEYLAGSVDDLIKLYKKDATKKPDKKSKIKATQIGGGVSDIIKIVNEFDDSKKEQGSNVIDFFNRFHSDVISRYTPASVGVFSDSINSISGIIADLSTTLGASNIPLEQSQIFSESIDMLLDSMNLLSGINAGGINTLINSINTLPEINMVGINKLIDSVNSLSGISIGSIDTSSIDSLLNSMDSLSMVDVAGVDKIDTIIKSVVNATGMISNIDSSQTQKFNMTINELVKSISVVDGVDQTQTIKLGTTINSLVQSTMSLSSLDPKQFGKFDIMVNGLIGSVNKLANIDPEKSIQFDATVKSLVNSFTDLYGINSNQSNGLGVNIESLLKSVDGMSAIDPVKIENFNNNINQIIASVDGLGDITPDSAQAFSTIVGSISNNVLTLGQSLSQSAPMYAEAAQLLPKITHTLDTLMNVARAGGITQENAEVTKIIIETLATNVLLLGQSLASSAKYYKAAEPALPIIGRVIGKLVTTMHENMGSKDDLERARLAAQTIQILSGSVLKLSKGLAISAPLMLLAIPGAAAFSLVMRIMSPAFDKLSNQAPMIKEGSQSLRHISLTMLMFGGSMALTADVLKNVAMKDAAKFAGMFALMGVSALMYEQIGKRGQNIPKGAIGVGAMAVSTVLFAGGLAMTTDLMRGMDMSDVPKILGLFGMMGVSALVYSLVGKGATNIIKGSAGIVAMSAATFIFAKATQYAVETVPDPAKLGILALEIGGLALVYGLAGSFASNILLGSLGVAAMGLSLMLISKPLESISGVMSENSDMLWKLPVMLTGLGAVYAGAGAITPLILGGAIGMAAIGGSLMLVGAGLNKMANANMTPEDADNMKYAMKSVVSAFTESFGGMTVKEAITLPLKMGVITGMGASLAVLGMGIGKYQEKAGGWDNSDADQLSYTISSLSQSFALAGSSEGMTKIFGFNVGKNDTERGVDATMRMGRNLSKLSDGIIKWKEMDLTEDDMQLISDNVTRVLTTIPNIFAAIGKSAREDSTNQMSILGVQFGIPFTKTDVELGISSTMKMGKNLKQLADGVTAWRDMPLTETDLQGVSDNITRVLTTIPNIFASIGKSQREDSENQVNFLGMSFGIPFTKTDVELGISSTMKIGKNLKELSEGVMAWKDGGASGFSSADLPGIQDNILSVLSAIPAAFAAVGKEDRESAEGILWWKKGDVEKGADIFGTIGPTLKSVADLVMGFKDIPDVNAHADNIGKGVSTMLKYLSEGVGHFDDDKIAILEDLPKPLGELTDVFLEWKDIFKDFMKMDFAKVEEAAMLAMKLDRIQKGLAPEPISISVDENTAIQEPTTSTNQNNKTLDAIAQVTNKSSDTGLMQELLNVLSKLQVSMDGNTAAISDMQEQLATGTIKTKEVSQNEF
jgi:hypothetical protein